MSRVEVLTRLVIALLIVAVITPVVSATSITSAQSATPTAAGDVAQPPQGANADGSAEMVAPDQDGDGIPDDGDNCAGSGNGDQADGDGDGIGDACEPDGDGDGVWDDTDTCPVDANPDQWDSDGNGLGDACDAAPVPSANPAPPMDAPVDTEDSEATEAGTIAVVAVDDAGAAVVGACFELYVDAGGARGDYLAGACDYEDGSDGTTTFAAVDPGAYVVVENPNSLPERYVAAPDQVVVLESGSVVDLSAVHQRVGSLIVLKVAPGGAPLPGACFDLYRDSGGGGLGAYLSQRCDAYDGTSDGTTGFESAFGDLVLVESQIPTGYLAAANLPVRVGSAEAKTVTVEDPLGGTLAVRSLDGSGAVLTDGASGACFQLWTDGGGGVPNGFLGESCDASDGANDGLASFVGLATGGYVLVNTRAPAGYLPVPNSTASVVAGQTAGLDVTYPRGGVVVVTVLGSRGAPLPGACFAAFVDAGGGSDGPEAASACDGADGAEDGSVSLVGLDGAFVLVQTQTPAGYLPAPDRSFRVKAGKTHKLVVTQDLGGVITLRLTDAAGDSVPGSGFDLWTDAGGGQLGSYMGGQYDQYDGANDGVMTFAGLASGRYLLREFSTPAGYLAADLTSVRVKAGKTVDVTVTNRRGGDLVIRTVDQTGAPIVGACYRLYPEGQETPVAFSCDRTDGQQEILGLRTGSYVLRQTSIPFGFVLGEDRGVRVVEGETTTVEVTNVELGTLVLHAVDETGQTLTDACYDVTTALGSRGEQCDNAGYGDSEADGYVTYEHIDGTARVVPTRAPDGHILAEPFSVDVAPGETEPVDVVFALGGSIEVVTVDDLGERLPGVCLNVYVDAGGGTLGDHVASGCDGSDGVADGLTSFLGLVGGAYVLVESFPPLGYRPIESRSVHVDLGEAVSVELTHQPISVLVVTTFDEADQPLPGACFTAYPDTGTDIFEWRIAEFCDDGDGANDGSMRFVGLEPGAYLLQEIVTPAGYLPLAAPQPFSLTEGQTTTVPVRYELGGSANVRLSGRDGAPLPGACFYLYADNPGPNGPFVAARCDGDDGDEDARSTFVGLATGVYRISTQAPPGYYVPADVAFQAQAGETVDVPVGAIEVGTLVLRRTAPGGAPVIGGCVVLYIDAGGGELGRNSGTVCDGMHGGPDGTAMVPILPGAYVAVDEYPPHGYLPAPNQTFTATSGETVEVTIVSPLGGVLIIHTTDQTGAAVAGGCFTAYRDTGSETLGEMVDTACDAGMDGSGVDGTTTLAGLEGDLVVVHTVVADGYLPAPNASLTVAAGETRERTVALTLGGTVRIEAVEAAGNPVVGSCFAVFRADTDGTASEEQLGYGCDGYDANGSDGVTVIVGLVGAEAVIVETSTPDGYLPADPTTVSVSIGDTAVARVTYEPA